MIISFIIYIVSPFIAEILWIKHRSFAPYLESFVQKPRIIIKEVHTSEAYPEPLSSVWWTRQKHSVSVNIAFLSVHPLVKGSVCRGIFVVLQFSTGFYGRKVSGKILNSVPNICTVPWHNSNIYFGRKIFFDLFSQTVVFFSEIENFWSIFVFFSLISEYRCDLINKDLNNSNQFFQNFSIDYVLMEI